MESVRCNYTSQEHLTIAQIDEVLNKGHMPDFLALLTALIADPNGTTATNMERLFHRVNIEDSECYAKEQFLAAYHLVMALREFKSEA